MIAAHHLNDSESSRLKKLYNLSGIDQRHSVLSDFGTAGADYSFFGNDGGLNPFPSTARRGEVYRQEAIGLSIKAVDQLKEQIPSLDLKDITHLITVSCTGMYAPGLDIDVVEKLSLNRNTERTCINFM